MKKFYSLLLIVFMAATQAIAGPIFSNAVTGNWNATTSWAGGVVPGPGDNAIIVPGANITITANATVSSIIFTGTAATARTLTVNSGVILTVTNSITLDNAIANNTTAAIAGAGTINCASLKVGGTITTGFTGDRTVSFSSTISALNISGNLTVRSEDEVSNQHNATFTHPSGVIVVTGCLVIDAEDDGLGSSTTATYNMNSGAGTGTLEITGTPGISATGTANFVADGTASTVVYSGADQAVRNVAYTNLALSGSGTKTMTGVSAVTGSMSLSGTVSATTALGFNIGADLTIGTGSQLTVAGFNFSVGGNTSISGTLVSNSITGNKSFDNITINNGGQFNSTANENYSLAGDLKVDGTGSITSGSGTWAFSGNGTLSGSGSATITNADFSTSYINNGTYSFVNLNITGPAGVNILNNKTITVSGTLTGNDNFVQGANGVLNFGGSSIAISGFTASASNNTVNYTAASQTIRATAYQNLTLSGSNTKTLSNNTTVNATLSMQGTAAMALGGFTLTYGASSTLEYAGSTAQSTTAVEFKTPGGPTNLVVNNSNGVSLHAARMIPGVVTFANGILTTTSSNLLIVGAAGSVSGASDASFVDGPVKKIGSGGFTFPVGKTGVGYMKIEIASVTGATTEFTAQYFRASAITTFGKTGLTAIGLQGVSNCEYWTLDRAVTTSSADVTMYWNVHSPCGGSYLSDPLFGIRIAHYNTTSSQWDAHGGGSPSGNAAAGSITWAGVSSFSPFALAALVGSQSSLPVVLTNVRGYEKNQGVQIEWNNLTEKDLVGYVVERSADGVSYIVINEQSPRSNNNDKQSYSAFDGVPEEGVNYYRIKVLELSGKIVYSKVIRVDIGKTNTAFALYPNPVKGNALSVSINNRQGHYSLKVSNANGQEIYSRKIVHQGGSMTQTIELPSTVKPGIYNIMISGDHYREAKIFIVQ
ncbi:MAG TPA: T9SS type A sorting domain-containing protein [Chitinophagaceae bacterium]|nr:T9SS type A sorting domain-containing protein [Chitinophagaceae bacterium]